MEENKSMEVFAKAPIRKAVLQNALPAMAAMLMMLIYNLADTFFIWETHDDLQVAAVSLPRRFSCCSCPWGQSSASAAPR
ncbi:MAG: hypothetical protein ACLR5G_06350 [Eubacteriales bacterium]